MGKSFFNTLKWGDYMLSLFSSWDFGSTTHMFNIFLLICIWHWHFVRGYSGQDRQRRWKLVHSRQPGGAGRLQCWPIFLISWNRWKGGETLSFYGFFYSSFIVLETVPWCCSCWLRLPECGCDWLVGEVPEQDRLVHGAAGQHMLSQGVPRQRQHSVLHTQHTH